MYMSGVVATKGTGQSLGSAVVVVAVASVAGVAAEAATASVDCCETAQSRISTHDAVQDARHNAKIV